MRGAIGVRINDGTADRTVTARVSGLKFSKQSDGGHKAASLKLTVPAGTFNNLGPSDRLYLYDTRTSLPLWEGYTESPTPTMGPNGESYDISALGGMIRAADETRTLVYVDKSLDGWAPELNASTAADYETVRAPTVPGMRTMFRTGLVANDAFAAIGYRRVAEAGMQIGGVRVFTGSGKNDTDYRAELFADGAGSGLFLVSDGGKITTTGVDQSFYVGVSYPRSPDAAAQPFSGSRIALQLRRTGAATNVADDLTYTDFVGMSVIGQRFSRDGVPLTGASALGPATSVYAHQVVEDLIGRLLTFCDPSSSTVAITSKAIDQLSYPDGATAQRVIDDLSDYEPDFLWEILHSTTSGHIFNYRPWPTTARYEISTRDGYSETGADVDLCNRVAVTWTDVAGSPQTTVVTATSVDYPALQALEQAGRVRDADPLALPDGRGSLANAQALGAAILGDAAGRPTPARAVVRRPILDLYTGSMVMPWEIDPGYVARVRETGREHRLTAMEYEDESCSASLTLGYPSLTRDQRIAQLAA